MLAYLYRNVRKLDFFYPYLRMCPGFILDKVAASVVKIGKGEVKKNGLPHHLTFFVTNRCNLRCSHCFYADQLNNGSQEMNIEQINRMALSVKGRLFQVILTGGEPFMRTDLAEICAVFENSGVKTITLMTNGYLCEKIESDVRKILRNTNIRLNFQVSIDGPSLVHNSIRGDDQSFAMAIRTIKILLNLKKGSRIDRITTTTVLNQENIGSLKEGLHELKKIKGILCGFTFVRGKLQVPKTDSPALRLNNFSLPKNVFLTEEQKKIAISVLDAEIWQRHKHNLFYAVNKMLLQGIIDFSQGGADDSKCMAGIADFVVYPNGDTGICEMLEHFGNLSGYDFNLTDFWNSEFGEHKEKITNCRCAHDCCIISRIKFNEKKLNTLLKYAKGDDRNVKSLSAS